MALCSCGALLSQWFCCHAFFLCFLFASQKAVGSSGSVAPGFPKKPRSDVQDSFGVMLPQRPGEKECAFYMKTGSCSFGASCRFDHPSWVPSGGTSGWKSGPGQLSEPGLAPLGYPERPGEQECAFYMRNGNCKYGPSCKYDHPRRRVAGTGPRGSDTRAVEEDPLPVYRHHPPVEAFYRQASQLQAGASVLADMPQFWGGDYAEGYEFDDLLPRPAALNGLAPAAAAATSVASKVLADDDMFPRGGERGGAFGTPAPLNSKGFPIRPTEIACPYYMKHGSCKFGADCKFNHPETGAGTSPPSVAHSLPQEASEIWFGNGAAPYRHQHPERHGVKDCDHYMRTGTCKYGATCKFNHPRVRLPGAAALANTTQGSPSLGAVKLTPAGYPRREGQTLCKFYMDNGTCGYGAKCIYDHPPPREAAAAAAKLAAMGNGSQEFDGKSNAKEQHLKAEAGSYVLNDIERNGGASHMAGMIDADGHQ